jgi:hypothetical protein
MWESKVLAPALHTQTALFQLNDNDKKVLFDWHPVVDLSDVVAPRLGVQ